MGLFNKLLLQYAKDRKLVDVTDLNIAKLLEAYAIIKNNQLQNKNSTKWKTKKTAQKK